MCYLRSVLGFRERFSPGSQGRHFSPVKDVREGVCMSETVLSPFKTSQVWFSGLIRPTPYLLGFHFALYRPLSRGATWISVSEVVHTRRWLVIPVPEGGVVRGRVEVGGRVFWWVRRVFVSFSFIVIGVNREDRRTDDDDVPVSRFALIEIGPSEIHSLTSPQDLF